MEKVYLVRGMVCGNCSRAIENRVKKHASVKKASVNYDSRTLSVEFCEGKELSIDKMNKMINEMGYELLVNDKRQSVLTSVGIITIIILIILAQNLGLRMDPVISRNMSFMMLFFAGILTSFHCIAMCGGIALTQSIRKNKSKSESTYKALKYNLGRVVSYTLLGGIIGAIGSVVTIGGSFRGLVSVLAGLFMVLLSIKTLGIVNFKIPKFRKAKTGFTGSSNSPFIVGLANGFMPCGPLQTMQLYALGTGTIIGGMSSMFFFSLGTVPMMLGLGVFTSLLSKNGGRKFLRASSVMVCILGLIMINRGLLLSGYGVSFNNDSVLEISKQAELNANTGKTDTDSVNQTEEVVEEMIVPYQIVDGVQVVQMSVMSDRYILSSPLVVGIPARIELDIQGINRCNSPVLIPKAGVEVDLLRNEPIMEFTPEVVGDLKITCWMGMITTNASIVESLPN